MKITLESTAEIVQLNGVDCRVWDGSTAAGIAIQALVPGIAVRRELDHSQFEAELRETPSPKPEGERAFPLRMLI